MLVNNACIVLNSTLVTGASGMRLCDFRPVVKTDLMSTCVDVGNINLQSAQSASLMN